MSNFTRPHLNTVLERLSEPRRLIQILAGPRQVGKTTLVRQALERAALPSHYASADDPTTRDLTWIRQQWEVGRLQASETGSEAVLVLDEIQKAPGWSDAVKALWDEDTAAGLPLKAILLGSAPLLVSKGEGESLAGRFELIRLPHWGYAEMREAFGLTLEHYLHFGAYPGAAALIGDEPRWRGYILDSLVEPVLARDVLLLSRVDKPALLRQLLRLGCDYSGQVLSYNKMLGQLQDAGNTTTLAHYLELLDGAGLVAGLQKYSGSKVRRRASSPKLVVHNTAIMTATAQIGLDEARQDRDLWGRLVETAVGAHLLASSSPAGPEVLYWRERSREVDYVVRSRQGLTAIEVASGRRKASLPGMDAFARAHRPTRMLLVGPGGVPLEEFLTSPVETWAV